LDKFEIRHAVVDGHDLYQEWMDGLRDARARVAVLRRVDRVAQGNFGDHKYCSDGVWELRIDVGIGYRVYYGLREATVVILLAGGDKRSQSRDIANAVDLWQRIED